MLKNRSLMSLIFISLLIFTGAKVVIAQDNQLKPIVGKGDEWKIKYYEFVNSSGKSIKRINVPEDKEVMAPTWLVGEKQVLVERTAMNIYHNHFLVVNTYKTTLDKNLYSKTGNYGYESVWIKIYDSTGNTIFNRDGVPYEFNNISNDGEKIACFIPCLQEDPNIEVPIQVRKADDDSLNIKGKIIVFDGKANVIFEEYTWCYGLIAFSQNSKWMAYTGRSTDSQGYLLNLETKEKYDIPDLWIEVAKKYKFWTINRIEHILDDGKIMGTIFYTANGTQADKFTYDPKTGNVEIVKE